MALRFLASGILTLVMSLSALAADHNAGAWKAASRAWKAFLAERGITDARVFSSQWCRCMDTAMPLPGSPEVLARVSPGR